MKIRNGFVSNSSSSSFIIAFKENLNESDFINTILKVSTESPLYNSCKEIYKLFLGNSEEIKDIEKYIEEEYLDLYYSKKMRKLVDENFIIRAGSFSNEEGGLESFLCDTEINIESESLIVYHRGY